MPEKLTCERPVDRKHLSLVLRSLKTSEGRPIVDDRETSDLLANMIGSLSDVYATTHSTAVPAKKGKGTGTGKASPKPPDHVYYQAKSWVDLGKAATGVATNRRDPSKLAEVAGDVLGAAEQASTLVNWELAARSFQQISKTLGFMKAYELATPNGQMKMVLLLFTEKTLLQFGFVSDAQGLKCGVALATLAVDSVAMGSVSVATGGLGTAFFAVSYGFTLVDAAYQCSKLLTPPHKVNGGPTPSPTPAVAPAAPKQPSTPSGPAIRLG